MTAIRIDVDGEALPGEEGQTIAAVLLTAGRSSWRHTRTGRPRGVFCGIGACFDCLVTVNGLRDVRACQRRATDGDRIALQRDDTEPTKDSTEPNEDSTEPDEDSTEPNKDSTGPTNDSAEPHEAEPQREDTDA